MSGESLHGRALFAPLSHSPEADAPVANAGVPGATAGVPGATAGLSSSGPFRIATRLALTRLVGLAMCMTMALAAAIIARPAAAQTPVPPTITGMRLGFNGFYKVGFWTPIEITLRGGSEPVSGNVEVIVPDGDGVPTRVTGRVALLPQRDTRLLLYVKIGEMFCDIKAEFRVAGRLAAEATVTAGNDKGVAQPISTSQELILTLGSPTAVAVEQRQNAEGEPRTKVVQLTDVSMLPTRWYGYEGVDWLVIAGGEPEMYRQLAANSARIGALDEWIRMGGKMLMYVGRGAEEILAPDAPLARFAPGRLKGTLQLRQTVPLEFYAETSDRVDEGAAAGGRSLALEAARLVDVRGKIEAFDGAQPRDLPLVIRTPRGFGQVVFVTVDLDRPPLKKWAGRTQMFKMLLGRTNAPVHETANPMGQVTKLGYDDLSGQLAGALQNFAGVQLVPFWVVAMLIIVYIACIGPLDFLLVKRVFKRMELTWITFPAIVLFFSLGAYFLAYALKGNLLHMNRVEVIDFDAETGAVRGTLWTNLYSPQIDSYDLSLDVAASPADPAARPQKLLSWMGLPGNAFGGMANTRTHNASLFNRPYDFAPQLDGLVGMPISVWSTKGITGRWYYAGAPRPAADGAADPPAVSVGVDAQLAATLDKTLSGTLVNNLSIPLQGAVLLYDRWAYSLEHLQPGQIVTLDNARHVTTIDTHFKPSDLSSGRAGTYDAGSEDLSSILEMMMFHEALGGESYTSLSNDYQGFLDVSGQLKAGRAILFGYMGQSAAQLLRDGQPLEDPHGKRATIYRFVLPVSPNEDQN